MRSPLLISGAKLLLAVSAASLLAGCASKTMVVAHRPGEVLVNPDYKTGQVILPVEDEKIPTLQEVLAKTPSRNDAPKDKEDRLRAPAMRDAAMSYGAKAGLAWESRNLNRMLQVKATELSRTYDFQRVMIKGPDNVMILPPVISQSKENWETSEAGKTLRVADTYYEIVEQARFTAVPPIWQAYLLRSYRTPDNPPNVLLPRDGDERLRWQEWVVEGWKMGRVQAQEIFQADLERLERDFNGMVRYKALLEEKKVSAPIVADAKLGTTGTGQDMRVNDRAVRITQDPSLQVRQPEAWEASPTTPAANGFPTGSDPAKPRKRRSTPAVEAGLNSAPEARPGHAPDRTSERGSRRAWDDSF